MRPPGSLQVAGAGEGSALVVRTEERCAGRRRCFLESLLRCTQHTAGWVSRVSTLRIPACPSPIFHAPLSSWICKVAYPTTQPCHFFSLRWVVLRGRTIPRMHGSISGISPVTEIDSPVSHRDGSFPDAISTLSSLQGTFPRIHGRLSRSVGNFCRNRRTSAGSRPEAGANAAPANPKEKTGFTG
jgi:hypothetical protein